MALADYRLCDVCGGKAFYDANLSYADGPGQFSENDHPYRVAGEEQYDTPELNQKYGMRLGYLGDWAVLCTDCAEKYEVRIVERTASTTQASEKL